MRQLISHNSGFGHFIVLILSLPLLFSAQVSRADSVSLHTANSKSLIAEIAELPDHQTVGVDSRWNYIRFTQATVPVWISEDFVSLQNGVAMVKPNALNARIAPFLSATVLTVLTSGYASEVLGSRNGFLQVKAPRSVVVAIEKQNLDSSSSVSQNAPSLDPVPQAEPPTGGGASGSISNSTAPQAITPNEPVRSNRHLIAPGDSISLIVFGEPDLSREDIRVAENGQAAFPLLGSLDISGKTTDDVEAQIESLLSKGYVRNPRVSVSMFSYRPIFIRGTVRDTGSFAYTQGLTVSKVVALAGGVTSDARNSLVKIERNGRVVAENLPIDSQAAVESGDVLSVSGQFGQTDAGESYIYLHGEVNNPGEYRYRRGLTVEKAVVLAGGFSIRASKRKITISRYAAEGEAPEKIKRAELYLPIESGDVINVGASWL